VARVRGLRLGAKSVRFMRRRDSRKPFFAKGWATDQKMSYFVRDAYRTVRTDDTI